MNSGRAKQILISEESIEVLYNGTPVWIENINENNQVEITNLKTRTRDRVPVSGLYESLW